MKQRTTLLVLLPALSAFAPVADRISFGPEAGTLLHKTFQTTVDMTLDDMNMLMNGQPPPMDMGKMEMTSSNTMNVAVTDEFRAVSNGKAEVLARTYDELSVTGESNTDIPVVGEQHMTSEGKSELLDKTVIFRWNETEGEYTTSFAEDTEADQALLANLEADMDFLVLLPTEDVEEGATWSIDPSELIAVVAPGGNLKIEVEVESETGGGMTGADTNNDLRMLLGDISGEASATLQGYREVDGRRLAVIGLTMDIESAKDMTDLMKDMLEGADLPMPPGASLEIESIDSEVSMAGEGELTWDVAAGHFVTFTMSVEMTSIIDTANSLNFDGQEITQETSIEMSGTTTFNASAEKL